MPLLALVLFAPWFAILGWAYWAYPKSHAVTPARRRLDVIALLLAVVSSAIAMYLAYFLPFDGVGKMWPQVIATLAGYHAFLLVLVVAYFIRRKRFRSV
ncbi:hypothetical protein [Arenimonas oryziterrae]|uniref:Uncharacterized protein n=1 Tax=Arenimonas oryziterrae DSM 21050 = YC6267 TaxID=1121015 RepID=A0A091BE01_9GAMM|nr:hypothetical protein [Arenimonas oryziterrae]KFN42640.1 hypothetical protein N789_13445 [Arenimonas oryziterrae DSM 21050 = YC6267]